MKKSIKLQSLLDEAAVQINERGASAIDLKKVAANAGLSRNNLYYYVADRNELIYRCYLQTCETCRQDLLFAQDEGKDAIERIELFIQRYLLTERAEMAVVTDLYILNESQREMIWNLLQANVQTLDEMLREGIAAGCLREVNSKIAAYTLFGLLTWSQLWYRWQDDSAEEARLKMALVAKNISSILLAGVANSTTQAFVCDIDLRAVLSSKINAFDRKHVAQEKSRQLIIAASTLFNRRGIGGLSLDELCSYVGVTKGAIYHYFSDKEQLVHSCYARAFELYKQFIDLAVTHGHQGFDKLMLVLHLNIQAQAGLEPPLILQPGVQAMPDNFYGRALELSTIMRAILQEAVEDKSCRALDGTLVELSAGAFFWIGTWLPAENMLSPLRLADDICDIFSRGLRAVA